jgi:hypothetical protein
VLVCAIVVLAGCGHSLSPLYEDYRISTEAVGDADIHVLIEQAVIDAGWTIDEPDAPNVVSTAEATVTHWGLYKVVVSLDVVAINNEHVRVFVHPYRIYIWGSRSKMPYMSRRIRNFVIPDLSETLADRGIIDVEINLADDTST